MSSTEISNADPASWWDDFESTAEDVGEWLWGTVEGAFNEKATTSQIIVDAVISVIPVVGDITAVRDIIAIIVRLIDEPETRDDVWQWVMLLVFIVALIPVFGGIAKGVGRLVCKAAEEAAKLAGPGKVKLFAESAEGIIMFLNHIGVGNAEKWFKEFSLAAHQSELIEKYNGLMNVLSRTLKNIRKTFANYLPDEMVARIDYIRNEIKVLEQMGANMIPMAIRDFDRNLREIQALVHAGGKTTSRTVVHEVETGADNITRTREARLVEGDASVPGAGKQGSFKQNPSIDEKEIARYYQPKEDYPNLLDFPDSKTGEFTSVAAFSGKMANEELEAGQSLYRLFGPGDKTLGENVKASHADGGWWGLGEAPKTPEEWRNVAAVLDEFNRDGYIVTTVIPEGHSIKAVTGTVSEQTGKTFKGQYLPGGGQQAVISFDEKLRGILSRKGQEAIATGHPVQWTDPKTGMVYNIRKTPWADHEVNGAVGYARTSHVTNIRNSALRLQVLSEDDTISQRTGSDKP